MKKYERQKRQSDYVLWVVVTTFELCKVELDLNRLFTLSLIEQQCFSSSEMIIAYSPHFRDWLIGIPFDFGAGLRWRIHVDSPLCSYVISLQVSLSKINIANRINKEILYAEDFFKKKIKKGKAYSEPLDLLVGDL